MGRVVCERVPGALLSPAGNTLALWQPPNLCSLQRPGPAQRPHAPAQSAPQRRAQRCTSPCTRGAAPVGPCRLGAWCSRGRTLREQLNTPVAFPGQGVCEVCGPSRQRAAAQPRAAARAGRRAPGFPRPSGTPLTPSRSVRTPRVARPGRRRSAARARAAAQRLRAPPRRGAACRRSSPCRASGACGTGTRLWRAPAAGGRSCAGRGFLGRAGASWRGCLARWRGGRSRWYASDYFACARAGRGSG